MLTKTNLFALILSGLLICPAFAKTITDEKTGVSVDLPDTEGWTLAEGATPTATCPEGVSLIVLKFDKETPEAVIKRIAEAFAPAMKEAKAGDEAEKVTVHSLDASKVSGYGSRDDKAVKFTALLISKDKTNTVAVIAVGFETAFKRHLRDIDGALDSVRAKE